MGFRLAYTVLLFVTFVLGIPIIDRRKLRRVRVGPPAVVYDPFFSVLMFRLLLATNPYLLQEAIDAYSATEEDPVLYHGLAETGYIPRYHTPGIYGYSSIDTVRDSQSFGGPYRVQRNV